MKLTTQTYDTLHNPDASQDELEAAHREVYNAAVEQGYDPTNHSLAVAAAKFLGLDKVQGGDKYTWQEWNEKNARIVNDLARREAAAKRGKGDLTHVARVGQLMREQPVESPGSAVTVDTTSGLVMTPADLQERSK